MSINEKISLRVCTKQTFVYWTPRISKQLCRVRRDIQLKPYVPSFRLHFSLLP